MSYRTGRLAVLLVAAMLTAVALHVGACDATSDANGSRAASAGGDAADGKSDPAPEAGPTADTAEVRIIGPRPMPEWRRLGPHGTRSEQWIHLEPGEREALVVYTGVSHGAITACGCANNPTGGLTKELTVVEQLRATGLPMLYVHPGDLFPFDEKPGKLPFVAEAAAVMGYDALSIGEQELAVGLAEFRKLKAANKLPYLSLNLRDGGSTEVAPGRVIKDVAGIRVAILSVMGSERYLYLDDAFTKEVIPQSAVDAVDAALKEIEGQADFVVLLSHQDKYLDRQMAVRFPRINLIIGGHDEELIPTPIRVGQTLICNAGILSEQVGVVRLAIDPEKHVRILGNEFLPTTAPVPKHPKIEAVYQKYVKATGTAPEENQEPLPQTYEPSAKCQPCHKAIGDHYATTPHAKAWKTLEKAGRAGDKACWYCHSMGYGRKGGFRGIAETPELANVSCQACHLVTHDHVARGIKPSIDYARDDRTCRQCHTRVVNSEFNVWQEAAKVDHHTVAEKHNAPPADYKAEAVVPDRELSRELKAMMKK